MDFPRPGTRAMNFALRVLFLRKRERSFMKESSRQRKFAKLILREMSEILQRDVTAPGKPLLTVTVVRATSDLGIARVYISVMPENQGQAAIDYFTENSKEIRHFLAQRIRKVVRHVPELQFFLDDSLQEVAKMDALFASLEEGSDLQVQGDPKTHEEGPEPHDQGGPHTHEEE